MAREPTTGGSGTSQQSLAGAGGVFALRPGVDTVMGPVVATAAAEVAPALSPDGRWLAYTSDASERMEVYVVPFPSGTGGKWTVSTRGGTEPAWSRDGRELFCRDGDGNIVAAEVRTMPTFGVGRSSVLFPGTTYAASVSHRNYDVAPDGRRFLMVRDLDGTATDRIVVMENWVAPLAATAGPKQ